MLILVSFECVLSRFSRVRLLMTLWTMAWQTSLCMGLSRQEYWNGFPCPLSPGGLPNPGTKPASLMSPVLAGEFFTTSTSWEALYLSSDTISDYLSIFSGLFYNMHIL